MIYCCGSIGDGRLQYGRSFHVVTIIIPTINEGSGTAEDLYVPSEKSNQVETGSVNFRYHLLSTNYLI